MSDLNEVIQESIEDAELPAEPVETPEPTEDAPVEAPDTSTETDEEVDTPAIASPVAKAPVEPDEFSKKFGIPQQSSSGRENRIPYSRVKKIVEKAVKDREAELNGGFTPKVQEFETKVKDYEGRLEKVAEFENVMINDPRRFLTMLAQIPVYNQIFTQLQQAQQPQQPPVDPDADMPQPDQPQPDGSSVYSMDGLKKLLSWYGNKVEQRVTQQVESRYAPIENQWKSQEYMARLVPQIQSQIDTARQWPLFNEHESEIVEALKADPRISLEGAYQKVVYPKLVADRTKMREEIMAEIKKAPTSTAVPARPSKPAPPAPAGNRSLEDIIREQVAGLK